LNNHSPASADYQGIKAVPNAHKKAMRKASLAFKKAQKIVLKLISRSEASKRKLTTLS
jgi:hypothetical protein